LAKSFITPSEQLFQWVWCYVSGSDSPVVVRIVCQVVPDLQLGL
jgi:hypothetical protein